MFEMYVLLLISILGISSGIRNLYFRKMHNKKYESISYLLYGIFGLIGAVTGLILGAQNWVSLYILIPMFVIGGGFGVIYRKKINNPITFRIDTFSLIIGIMLITFLLLVGLE